MDKFLTVKQTTEMIKESGIPITAATVRNWIPRYNLGNKIGGKWLATESKVKEFIDGQFPPSIDFGKIKEKV